MPANNLRTLDQIILDEIDEHDLNLELLYNLIHELYFKINESSKKKHHLEGMVADAGQFFEEVNSQKAIRAAGRIIWTAYRVP